MSAERWPYPRVVAHRGGGTLAPENTLAALRYGASRGFRGVEFDVMLAGDATALLIHDETLERTTTGKGSVPMIDYAEIEKLDAGSWHGERFRGETVPTFVAAAKLCRALGLWANVEIKPAKGFEVETGRVVAQMTLDLWQGADPNLLPLVSSFSLDALVAAKAVAPSLPRGMLVGRIPGDWLAKMRELGCVALHCNYRHLSESLAAQIHAAGYAVLCWTVNDPAEANKLLGWGVDCIVTDRLDLIAADFSG
ncbi:MAG: glycerophosphodiester phosphodiesterase [Betaproteobacteria bacterium]|nr:glycerophosphodiester phosphodiesterase [Betaproteobacteria bacterium]